jgi:plasmid stabilization system protein ParE
MAEESRELTVEFTVDAWETLEEIWRWNARKWGFDHAAAYVQFLRDEAQKLSTEYPLGRVVRTRPEFRFRTLRSSSQGHAHVILFRVRGDVVLVLDFYHTAEDWQKKLPR